MYTRVRGVATVAIDRFGGQMRQDERDIEKYLRDRVKKIGGLCWKFLSMGTDGVPDRLVIYKGQICFVELKAKDGRLSAIQKYRHEQLKRHGHAVKVLWSREDVDDLIRYLRIYDRTENHGV